MRVIELVDADDRVIGLVGIPRSLLGDPPVLWNGDLYQPTGRIRGYTTPGLPIAVYRRTFMFRADHGAAKGDTAT